MATLGLATDSPTRMQFLHRLHGEVAKRGVIDVLPGASRQRSLDANASLLTPRAVAPRFAILRDSRMVVVRFRTASILARLRSAR